MIIILQLKTTYSHEMYMYIVIETTNHLLREH